MAKASTVVGLEPIQVLALAKALTDSVADAARKQILPGQYRVEFDVRVSETLTVGADYEQHIVAKADPWYLLKVALDKLNGVSLDALVAEALALQDGNGTAKKSVDEFKTRVGDAVAVIKTPTLTQCKGKVTVPSRLVTRLEEAAVVAAPVMLREEIPAGEVEDIIRVMKD